MTSPKLVNPFKEINGGVKDGEIVLICASEGTGKSLRSEALEVAQAELDKALYAIGYHPPRYPVPAIPVGTGYVPEGISFMVGIPYIYIASQQYCWTMWADGSMTIERDNPYSIEYVTCQL